MPFRKTCQGDLILVLDSELSSLTGCLTMLSSLVCFAILSVAGKRLSFSNGNRFIKKVIALIFSIWQPV